MWPFGFHVDKTAGLPQGPLSTDDEAVAVVCTAIGHVVALWTSYFVAGKIRGREKFNLCDNDLFVAGGDSLRGGILESVGGDEEGV